MIDKDSLYIGLMSGTSMDGVDCVIVSFDEKTHQAHVIATHLENIPKELKNEAMAISLDEANVHFTQVALLDSKFGHLFAQSVNNLLRKAKINASEIKAIGSHGQTIWHHPQQPVPFTIQIGDPNIIAKETNITTVADFRRGDIALGGQGAPFVPPFHAWLLGTKASRVILNIGGIANITLLPFQNEPTLGFDTGPGNGLMDAWTFKHLHQPFDNNGAFAKTGAWHAPLLSKMLTDPFFAQKAPKSTGKDYFSLHWLEKHLAEFSSLAPKDVQATLLELTAITIAEEIQKYRKQAEVLVCGGGCHNPVLLATISRHLGNQFQLKSTEEYGVAPDWLEAVCFAWYAKKRLNKEAIDLTNITGSSRPVILGGIYEA
ncbi:MAG: anhydro-N-acetylmuramic acid kinase [Gammaproteobacteria bacterium]|jgi:anhydro-N-acetylmuramic acid kinase|nr:anhydro-N-acetylmuramic acid kinase [Gammaproteobacteria bacterium]